MKKMFAELAESRAEAGEKDVGSAEPIDPEAVIAEDAEVE